MSVRGPIRMKSVNEAKEEEEEEEAANKDATTEESITEESTTEKFGRSRIQSQAGS